MTEKLRLDDVLVDRCRSAAVRIADGLNETIATRTTISVERTVARLLGVDGVDSDGVPLPNVVVEQVHSAGELSRGIFYWLVNASMGTGMPVPDVAAAVGRGELSLTELEQQPVARVHKEGFPLAVAGADRIADVRRDRADLLQRYPSGGQPWIYVIVATGNIYEDIEQARAAALQGADIVAVIRSTAQSLLDYVPYGPTTEGFGGTYATQENFRIMRKALDETAEQTGRYVRLVNYASGLCMPEIAAMGALERLDMMLNDAIYGILFRDINMERTFIDQHFSRLINAVSGIIINTGEDNYLTTSDAVEEAHTVLASQFINRELARRSGLPASQTGLGHAFEINPDMEDGFLYELAQAQLVRQIFPDCPIKYMPPTKHMTGNVFRGHLMDGMFNLAGILTDQGIQLLGMLTEAIHTPFLQDRALAIENARYVFNTARHLGEEIIFRPDGRIQARADQVLAEASRMLERIAAEGLIGSIEQGMFAGISRSANGGKGADGVIIRANDYLNPFTGIFAERTDAG